MSKVINTESFIKKSKEIHGDKYDYSKVKYKKSIEHVIIVCKIHGNFYQSPNSHLNGGGCKKCASSRITSNTENFIKKSIN